MSVPFMCAGGGFDSRDFMDMFSERFLWDVNSHSIVSRLVIKEVIPEEVAFDIKSCSNTGGNEDLFLFLKYNADPDSISKLCDVMRSIAGYPRMSELGRAMKEELDLLTSKSSCVEMWSDPVLDSPMYSTIHCGVCAFMYLFTSIPKLTTCTCLHTHYMYSSTYSLHVLVYILTTCTCLHTHYMYSSTYSLHVLVYILTTCTCLHTHYMYLSTYSLHVLVYILTTYAYACSPQSWWGFSGPSPIGELRQTFPSDHDLHTAAAPRTTITIL